MVQKPLLRLTKSLSEVQTAFKNANTSNEIMLWYNTESDRALFMANLLRVDLEQKKIILQLKETVPLLEKQKKCFLKLFKDEGVSSCNILQIKDNLLVLEFPEEIVMSERRQRWRAQFIESDKKLATLNFSGHDRDFEVMNASSYGLAIRIDEKARSLLSSQQDIKLVKLNGTLIGSPASFVVHPSGQSCGLELKNEIPDLVFSQFIQVDRPLAVDPKKLYLDQEYRAVVRSNMKQVLSKLEKKSKLNLKVMKINREGTNYLKDHTELLCEITCSVGKILGWMTDGTVEKLIYISYMHDIRFFNHPHLARISGLDEFNKKKATLSAEEQKMYLEGPAYSAMLAAEDEANSADVEKILISQKERPDGSGFPNALRSYQLGPLTCLFILCHEFVDYILTEPRWSFREFVMRSKPVHQGPHFAKILQAMMSLEFQD